MKKYCEGKVKRTLKRGSKALEIVIRKAYATIDCLGGVQRAGRGGRSLVDCKRLRGDGSRSFVRLCLAEAYQRRVGGVHEGGGKVLRRVRSLGTYRLFFWHSVGLVEKGTDSRGGSRTGLRPVGGGFFVCASSGGLLCRLEGVQFGVHAGETVSYDPS